MSLQRYISFTTRSAALSLASTAQAVIHSAYERILPVRKGALPLKILAVQCGQVGDFVLTLPFFDEIKKGPNGKTHVSVIVDSVNEDMARKCPNIDEVLIYDSPKYTRSIKKEPPAPSGFLHGKAFDAALWFRGDWKIFYWILRKKVPMVSVAKYPNPLRRSWITLHTGRKTEKNFMHYSECIMSMASELTGVRAGANGPRKPQIPHGEDKTIFMHAGAGNGLRKWPEENFARLSASLLGMDRGLIIRMVGSSLDAGAAQRIIGSFRLKRFSGRVFNDCGTTTLPGLAEKLSKGRLFIGFDSGPMHLAASSGIPIVALMGPQSPQLFRPRGGQEIRVIYKDYPCSPCWQFRCLHTDHGPGWCVLDIRPEEVFDEARDVLLKTGVIHES